MMLIRKQTPLYRDFQKNCEMILKGKLTFAQKANRLNKAYENEPQGREIVCVAG